MQKSLDAEIKKLSNLDVLQKTIGLYQAPVFLTDMATTLEYGYQDQLEAQMRFSEKVLSANLKRSCLREPEELLIRKYSRKTEVEFVLLGVVTQIDNSSSDVVELKEGSRIKEALMAMVDLMTNVESTFTGRLENEVIVDPIALYTEIR